MADDLIEQTQFERIRDEITDSFDEELEQEMEDDRLEALLKESGYEPTHPAMDRKVYFRELFRLQHELVRLQDWIVHKKLKLVVLLELCGSCVVTIPTERSCAGR